MKAKFYGLKINLFFIGEQEMVTYKVAIAKDNWQERTYLNYCQVIAHLCKFGIPAPAPKSKPVTWRAGVRNEWYVQTMCVVNITKHQKRKNKRRMVETDIDLFEND